MPHTPEGRAHIEAAEARLDDDLWPPVTAKVVLTTLDGIPFYELPVVGVLSRGSTMKITFEYPGPSERRPSGPADLNARGPGSGGPPGPRCAAM